MQPAVAAAASPAHSSVAPACDAAVLAASLAPVRGAAASSGEWLPPAVPRLQPSFVPVVAYPLASAATASELRLCQDAVVTAAAPVAAAESPGFGAHHGFGAHYERHLAPAAGAFVDKPAAVAAATDAWLLPSRHLSVASVQHWWAAAAEH